MISDNSSLNASNNTGTIATAMAAADVMHQRCYSDTGWPEETD